MRSEYLVTQHGQAVHVLVADLEEQASRVLEKLTEQDQAFVSPVQV